MYTTVHGLVVRDVDYKETDKILTLITAEEGKMTVSARGVRRNGHRHSAVTQVLCYSRMILSEYRERFTLKEAELMDAFCPLRQDLEGMALGVFLAQAAEVFIPEKAPAPDILRLTLQGLRHLSQGDRPHLLVKAAFEMALMCRAGFAPALDGCAQCGGVPHHPRLDIAGGTVLCGDCTGTDTPSLLPGVWQALLYISRTPNRPYGFSLDEGELNALAALSERYFRTHTDCPFPALDFYYVTKGVVRKP